ncbi:glutathione S-transferase family protein [Candidatus Binatia bacterium]|nr:glutathione S-transferase family protein [Candidatus Binatia bacterium]
MIKLYYHVDCPYSQKVRIVLAEKDLEHELVHVDLAKGDHKTAEFRKLNPLGKVPVLVDEDVVVYDSTIIDEYLDEEYPNPSLMPEDSAGRARVRLLEDFCDSFFIPQTVFILTELHRSDAERDQEKIRRYSGEIQRVLQWLEPQLAGKPFLVGDFSIADAAFAGRAVILSQLGVEIDPRLHNVAAWIGRLYERPSVRALGV